MKIIHRIPTTQYGYVEIEKEVAGAFDPKLYREEHEELLSAFAEKPENVMSDKDLTDYIYNALNGIPNSPDVWETMHPIQKRVLQCYKNASNRKKPV